MAKVIERRYLNTFYEKKFKFFHRCVYCGDQAQHRDHVYPVSCLASLDLGNESIMRHLKPGLKTVPACGECNTIAGAKPFLSVLEKRAYIQSKLKERHSKILRTVMWSEEDKEDISGNLLRQINQRESARVLMEMRVYYPKLERTIKS